eukprot:4955972-Prymnesium_polylepis.1
MQKPSARYEGAKTERWPDSWRAIVARNREHSRRMRTLAASPRCMVASVSCPVRFAKQNNVLELGHN